KQAQRDVAIGSPGARGEPALDIADDQVDQRHRVARPRGGDLAAHDDPRAAVCDGAEDRQRLDGRIDPIGRALDGGGQRDQNNEDQARHRPSMTRGGSRRRPNVITDILRSPRCRFLTGFRRRAMRRWAPGPASQLAEITARRGGTPRDATPLRVLEAISTRSYRFVAVVATLLAGNGAAHADVHGVFRIGVEPLGLEPSDGMPFIGNHVGEAVTAYNAAATAYNRAHGYAAGSTMASATIDRSDL